jgi:signal transduction histidine kinase/ActR/RegA family two-component response regulator
MQPDKTGASHVLILAPIGRDADITASVLSKANVTSKVCRSLSELSELLREEASSVGAVLLTDEALSSPTDRSSLYGWLERQEPWSDLPIVVLTRSDRPPRVTTQRIRTLGHPKAVTLLERPVKPATLISTVRVALQSRERQFQVRDLLEFERRASVELQKARLEAEAANRAKDQFLAILSHELRNPLNAILGWTYLMRDSRKDESLVAQGIEVLQRSTGSIIEIISDLLDISRIVTGNLTLNFQEVDLKQIISASLDAMRVEAADKGIALQTFVEVPEAVSCRVWGDEARLTQILANLLNNAFKFTPRGGSVSVQLRKAETTAIVAVKDTGKGILPEFLPLIFQRFSRGDSISGENSGLGLGLAICKHLVELHGGSIAAESEGPGHGAMISFELPTNESKCEPSAEHYEKSELGKARKMGGLRLKNIKVVAVDDNSDSRQLLKAILERNSAEVTVVSSGQAALAAVRSARPDILICDLAIPEMDGYEVLENIRRLEPPIGRLPVIALTAAARNEDRARTQRAGFQAHLAKPVDPDELIRTILELARLRTDSGLSA